MYGPLCFFFYSFPLLVASFINVPCLCPHATETPPPLPYIMTQLYRNAVVVKKIANHKKPNVLYMVSKLHRGQVAVRRRRRTGPFEIRYLPNYVSFTVPYDCRLRCVYTRS